MDNWLHMTSLSRLWAYVCPMSNHRHLDCLLNHFFKRRSNNTSKLRVTGLSFVTGEFPTQRASNGENISIKQHEWAPLSCHLSSPWWVVSSVVFSPPWPISCRRFSVERFSFLGHWSSILVFSEINTVTCQGRLFHSPLVQPWRQAFACR